MDWTSVKKVRGVDRREDGHGGFVAYVASFGGCSSLENNIESQAGLKVAEGGILACSRDLERSLSSAYSEWLGLQRTMPH